MKYQLLERDLIFYSSQHNLHFASYTVMIEIIFYYRCNAWSFQRCQRCNYMVYIIIISLYDEGMIGHNTILDRTSRSQTYTGCKSTIEPMLWNHLFRNVMPIKERPYRSRGQHAKCLSIFMCEQWFSNSEKNILYNKYLFPVPFTLSQIYHITRIIYITDMHLKIITLTI